MSEDPKPPINVSEIPAGMRPIDVAVQMTEDVQSAVEKYAAHNVPIATAIGVLEIVKYGLMKASEE